MPIFAVITVATYNCRLKSRSNFSFDGVLNHVFSTIAGGDLQVKAKIFISFFQVVGTLEDVYGIQIIDDNMKAFGSTSSSYSVSISLLLHSCTQAAALDQWDNDDDEDESDDGDRRSNHKRSRSDHDISGSSSSRKKQKASAFFDDEADDNEDNEEEYETHHDPHDHVLRHYTQTDNARENMDDEAREMIDRQNRRRQQLSRLSTEDDVEAITKEIERRHQLESRRVDRAVLQDDDGGAPSIVAVVKIRPIMAVWSLEIQ